MSDTIKHECGIALIRLLKPLEYYKEKYGSAFYGVNKMYLMLEKQHNRGQDGAGVASIKLNMQPGERYISRIRSNEAQPVQDIFTRINQRINEGFKANTALKDNVALQKRELPYIGEVIRGTCATVPLARTASRMYTLSCAKTTGYTATSLWRVTSI